MYKRIYISADYDVLNGDRAVVNELHRWSNDNRYLIKFADTATVASGSVSNNPDCRPCDLKKEFNKQINASSTVIFIIGDRTASRTAGNSCRRRSEGAYCSCTPYKRNVNGSTICKHNGCLLTWIEETDVNEINNYSYLEHEFRQAQKQGKKIIVVYNSMYRQPSWLPSYMSNYDYSAQPFWIKNYWGERVGNYDFIKKALGYV